MKFSRTILFFFTLFITLSTKAYSETFMECLTKNSNKSYPISSVEFSPGNGSYSTVLENHMRNLRFNISATPKPFLIITATHESHVQAAVICGKAHNLQMKIRSGGHDYDGLSYVTYSLLPFFVLDMFNLSAIDVDVKNKTAWVGTGATLGKVYYTIWKNSNTLGFPAGVCPTVGVGGHISGGGYGNMLRKYGLTVDNTIDAKIVDVNGKILYRSSMGEDLFWAISGGGGSSFGVVLSYKIKLVDVPQTVTVFKVTRTLDQKATDIVYSWQQVAPKLPDELFIRLLIDVTNDTVSKNKTITVTFMSLFLGNSPSLVSIMKEKFPKLGLKPSDCIETSWIQSVLFWANYNIGTSEEVLLNQTESLTYLKRKSDYVENPISKEGLESIWKKMIELEIPSFIFNPYGGQMARISPQEKPFPHRAGNLWKIQYKGDWNDKLQTERNINLVRQLYDFMTPFVSKNPRRAFYNYRDVDLGINFHDGKESSYEEGERYGRKYFAGNFDRLVDTKTRFDSGDFFRNEQSVPVSRDKRN